MLDIDAGGGAVDVLTAGALGADEGFFEVRFAKVAGGHAGTERFGFLGRYAK